MRLTTKGRFAVTAMIDLALRQNNGPVTLAAISQRQQISLSYLEQLFGKLRRHQLVESTRGPGGGYTLARKATDITVADIILSVDEPIDATQCGGKENCLGEGARCMTHELWASLNERMVDFLASVKLQKLVDDQIEKRSPEATGNCTVDRGRLLLDRPEKLPGLFARRVRFLFIRAMERRQTVS